MKTKNLLTAVVFTLLYIHLNAQNNDGLQSINKQKLESLLKEHKQLHFVTTNGSNGAELKFYIDNDKQEKQTVSKAIANGSAANNFHLVKDINTQTDANPVNPGLNINSDGPYAVLNNVMYFSANDGVNGAELWRSDGTASGTYMVKDIEPGINSSNPSEITVAGNKIIFSTQNKVTFTYALWVSDGTAAGTSILKDNLLGSGPGVNGMYELTNVSGTVYFFLNYNAQLWKTNGTVAGTSLVKDMGVDAYAPFLPVAANGLFYFTMFSNANGRELWRSDGTNAGTFMLKDIAPGFDFFSGPAQLTVFNNKLYFTANDGSGRKLWLTDGTTPGTMPAGGQNNVLFMEDILMELFNRPFVVIGSNFYTAASTGTTGTELYKYNVASGFSLVKDILPGMPGGQFFYYEKLGNNVAFTYYDSVNRQNQLWRSDGTAANTVLIKSYGGDTITLANLHAGNKLLYFTSNASNGYELWKTNGTSAGTALVKDIYVGPTSTNPANLTLYKDKMYFKAASKNAGTEMWQTDGTETGTIMLPEINTTSTNYSAPDYSFSYYYNNNPGAALDKTLYFSATTPETGYELYRSKGIAAGTALTSDLVPGEKSSTPRNFLNKNHAVYFMTYLSNGGYSINKVDSAGSVRTLVTGSTYLLSFDVADNGLVFYVLENYLTNKTELWRVADDGSGNIMLSDKLADINYRFIIKVVNNKAYFTAADENGTELWVSNGNVAGTRMVKDIFAGSNSSNPFSLYGYNNNIFFGANDGSGPALWRSNGTDAVKVKNISPYGDGNVSTADYNDFFCVVNNVLYLNATTADKGFELWKTNGTTAGTVLVKDIFPGTESGNPSFLTNVNGTLFFSVSSYQLWKSDGTANGTVIVKDNMYSPDYFLFTERCVADGKLFFNTGHLLWVSDGTDAGTHQVADNGLNGVSNVKNLVAADNIVFLNGTTDKYNAELYAGDATKITSKTSSVVKQVQPQSFSAVVLQNPIVSQLKLQVQSFAAQSLIITVSNMNGNVIAQKTVDAVKGNNEFSLNASNWQTGIHAIKISNTKGEMISLKVLK